MDTMNNELRDLFIFLFSLFFFGVFSDDLVSGHNVVQNLFIYLYFFFFVFFQMVLLVVTLHCMVF